MIPCLDDAELLYFFAFITITSLLSSLSDSNYADYRQGKQLKNPLLVDFLQIFLCSFTSFAKQSGEQYRFLLQLLHGYFKTSVEPHIPHFCKLELAVGTDLTG